MNVFASCQAPPSTWGRSVGTAERRGIKKLCHYRGNCETIGGNLFITNNLFNIDETNMRVHLLKNTFPTSALKKCQNLRKVLNRVF